MRIAIAFVLAGLCACGSSASTSTSDAGAFTVTGASWPEADALFHQDPRWLGADAAYSVPLGGDRTLWLFGDTFVATSPADTRSQAAMPRNTIAVQTGLDPSTATIAFYWNTGANGPSSFFPEDGADWFWPEHGIRIGATLVVFLVRVRSTPGQGLGFALAGWRAVLVDNPDATPDQWHLRAVDPSAPLAGIDLAEGLILRDDGFVYALAIAEAGAHAGYLARWASSELAAGNVDAVQWWDGAQYRAGATPAVVLPEVSSECSLHFDTKLQKFVLVRSDGFGASQLVMATADELEGPWSAVAEVFRPPEDDRSNPFVYAGKAHPELLGADLVATYASNRFDFTELVNDTTLYYPRFVKLTYSR